MNKAELIASIDRTVRDFANEAATLEHLKRGRVERTIATDLANRLKPVFEMEGISVDSPYNKHGDAAKRLGLKLIELDIAIHKRGVDGQNVVAIELETNNTPARDDIWKLEGLTKLLGGYEYKLGLYVAFGIKARAGEVLALEWYSDGRRLQAGL